MATTLDNTNTIKLGQNGLTAEQWRLIKLATNASNVVYNVDLPWAQLPDGMPRIEAGYVLDNQRDWVFQGGIAQPYASESGWTVIDTQLGEKTGAKAAVFFNASTNEIMVTFAGMDGMGNGKDVGSAVAYNATNQIAELKNQIESALNEFVKDPANKNLLASAHWIIDGQSMGAANAALFTGMLVSNATIIDPETGMPAPDYNKRIQLPGTLQVDAANVTFIGLNGEGVTEQAFQTTTGMTFAQFHDMGVGVVYATVGNALNPDMRGDLVTPLLPYLLPSGAGIVELPADGVLMSSGPSGYHSIQTGLNTGIQLADEDMSRLIIREHQTFAPEWVTDFSRWVSTLGAPNSASLSAGEGYVRAAIVGAVSMVVSPPGTSSNAVGTAVSEMFDNSTLGKVLGFGSELLLKAFALQNPVVFLKTMLGGLGLGALLDPGQSNATDIQARVDGTLGAPADGVSRSIFTLKNGQVIVTDIFDNGNLITSDLNGTSKYYNFATGTTTTTSKSGLVITREESGVGEVQWTNSKGVTSYQALEAGDVVRLQSDGSAVVQHNLEDATFTNTVIRQSLDPAVFDISKSGKVTVHLPTTSGMVTGEMPITSLTSSMVDDAGQLVMVAERDISGHRVKVEFVEDEWGDLKASRVLTVDGQAPANAESYANALNTQGYSVWDFADGQAPSGGSDVGSLYTAFNPMQPTGAQTLTNAINQYGSTLIDALSIIKAIQSGNPLPIAVSGLRLANDINNLADLPANYNLSGAASVGSSILSVLSLEQALQRGDTMAAVTAGAQALGYGASAYLSFAKTNSDLIGVGTATDISDFFNGTRGTPDVPGAPGAIAYLNLVNDISHGDAVGVAIDAMYFIPGLQEVAVAVSIFRSILSLFGDDDPPPEPWGNAWAGWSGFSAVANSNGGDGGQGTAAQAYNGFISYLNQLAASEQALNPGSAIGIVANRLPSLSYRNYTGFGITDIDSVTGVQRDPFIRYDLTGRPYNAPPGSDQASQSLSERFIRVALARGAVAPMWEVQTAAIQTQYGDPQAGLTEEERAGRNGKLAAPVTGDTQTFRAVALDLNGDGVQTTGTNKTVAFDVDDSGFLKNTAWLDNHDGFLFLDRNLNGSIDSGRELFSNSIVDLSARGLAGMRWVDSNYDGKLTNADPVWNELKVWQDANGDGQAEAGEVKSLSDLGITALDYAMGRFERNGQLQEMSSPDLAADTAGTRTHVVPEGIVVETTSGHTSLLVTRIDDETVIEANRDGITSYEDIEAIVSTADLMANDMLGGFVGQNLTVTGVTNFTHGTGYLDGNGFVHYTPSANYYGPASFSYTIQAPTGQTDTATVDINLLNVNDAPIVQASYGSDGKIVVTDIDDPNGPFTYEVIAQPQMGSASIDANGVFHYANWYGPNTPGAAPDGGYWEQPYATGHDEGSPSWVTYTYPVGDPYWVDTYSYQSDPFTVRVTDPHGASGTSQVYSTHSGAYYPSLGSGGGGKKPISIDLGNDGFAFTNVDDSNIFFDINGDGFKHRTAWPTADDGLLAYDIDGNGKIEHADEISFAGYKYGAQTDLEGLKAFDSNGDGLFSAADDKWSKFGVWQDANQNGITDPGEFRTLADMGVASIALTSDGQFSIVNDQTVHGVGTVTKTDGSTLNLADVTMQYSSDVLINNPDGTSQVVVKPPFSPSGEELNGTDGNDLILGKTGNNIINAGAGDDVVMEDGGNDFIDGGDGNDTIYSGADNDLVIAGAGDDVVFAGLSNDMVLGGDGNDALFGEGGNDVIFGGKGNDLISGDSGNDVLSGDAGDDQVYGGSGNDAVFGGAGNDELAGMDGYDRLDGGTGNDLLDGGADADEMIGGAGDDIYVVDNVGDIVTENPDEGIDTVRSSISYTLGANLENLTLTGTENLTGTGNDADNVLIGNSGDNTLTAGAGNDTLDGGQGADTLIGGTGDDVYVVDNAGDIVFERPDEGTDSVLSSASYALTDNVENLVLTGRSAIDGSGNTLDNVITGNIADNTLDGGAGADTLTGGRGNDTYVVDNTGDRTIELANEGVDTVVSSLSWTLAENIENLALTGTDNLTGTGNELDNVLVGNAGNNHIDGGLGADTMAGGAGDDAYIVDNADDVIIEVANEGNDSIFASVSYILSDNVENLMLTGTANIEGNGNVLDNVLTGNIADNVLDGGAGADALAGGAGNDTYVIDNAGDTVTELADEGIDAVQSSIDYTLGANVENLALTGMADLNGSGNELDNVIAGNDGNNLLLGAAGNDTLTGNGGNDILNGGVGADVMAGGAGDDIYAVESVGDLVVEQFNAGLDHVYSSISYVLPENVENLTLTGTDAIDGIGNGLDNVIVGNGAANLLDGGAGADTLAGGAGDDTYVVDNAGDAVVEAAGEGIDQVFSSVSYALADNVENLTLTGTAAIDGTGNILDNAITGNSAANVLDGGLGADVLTGSAGDDIYIVDNAGDRTVELAGEGTDSVYASVSYALADNVENLYFTGTGNIDGSGNGLANRLVGNAADNRLYGGAGDDLLFGDAGNDFLDGGTGNDLLNGGTGNDTYLWRKGDGLDGVYDTSGNDAVQFGAGLTLDNLALRVTDEGGLHIAHLRALNEGGCEMADQGFDFLVETDRCGKYVSPIEKFYLADGTALTFDDLLIKTEVTKVRPNDGTIIAGRNDDIIYGSGRSDLIYAGTGNDTVYASAAKDTVYGQGGNDALFGGSGSDTLDGGCGNDLLFGSAGRDTLYGGGGNNLLDGGVDNDVLTDGTGNAFFAGGRGNDTLTLGGGNDIVAFNRGDGKDVVELGNGNLTLSLGKEIRTRDLSLGRSGQDLILKVEGCDSVALKGWYTAHGNTTLQMVQEGNVKTFDFNGLAAAFDGATANKDHWTVANALPGLQLSSSDKAAIGGDLAYRYGTDGDVGGLSIKAQLAVLSDTSFGEKVQLISAKPVTGHPSCDMPWGGDAATPWAKNSDWDSDFNKPGKDGSMQGGARDGQGKQIDPVQSRIDALLHRWFESDSHSSDIHLSQYEEMVKGYGNDQGKRHTDDEFYAERWQQLQSRLDTHFASSLGEDFGGGYHHGENASGLNGLGSLGVDFGKGSDFMSGHNSDNGGFQKFTGLREGLTSLGW